MSSLTSFSFQDQKDKINILSGLTPELHFPLGKHGYTLERVLNNKNRWHTKMVCSIIDKDFKRYVSTTCAGQNDYLKLLETTTYLKCKSKLSPKIVNLYPEDRTVVCEYIGDFFTDYLLNNSDHIHLTLVSVYDYLKGINCVHQDYKTFIIPSIVKTSLQLSKTLNDDFEFLPEVTAILPGLERSNIKFIYGYGIEDPHIWNFRIINTTKKIQALTTDYDYFSDKVNCFWELGYFYATFRWFKKISFSLARKSEEALLSLMQDGDLKSEFMFWLGALSSYCGYKDSLRNLVINGGIGSLKEQYRITQKLDQKVAFLAGKLLANQIRVPFV